MSGCSLVHEPCRRPEKIGGLAQVLQRRTPTWSDRPTDADYVAESRWRSQPATVKEAGKLYLPAIQSSASLHSRRNSIIKWQGYRVSASRLDEPNFRYTQPGNGTKGQMPMGRPSGQGLRIFPAHLKLSQTCRAASHGSQHGGFSSPYWPTSPFTRSLTDISF